MPQCDALDGLADGGINNYLACRTIFAGPDAWAGKRGAGNQDAIPSDISATVCLTDGQIATLQMVYRPYRFATPLANGVDAFGMWLPNTDPAGSGRSPS